MVKKSVSDDSRDASHAYDNRRDSDRCGEEENEGRRQKARNKNRCKESGKEGQKA
jgi:hypothetical protein